MADYEHQLMADPLVSLQQPFLSLVLYDTDSAAGAPDGTHILVPIHIPYSNDDLLSLGGTKRRGQLGRFVGNLAGIFAQVPSEVLRTSLPEWSPDLRLLFAVLAAETIHVAEKVPDHFTDYELDVPAERQLHVRNVLACDGRGFMYQMTRPDTGCPGPPHMKVLPCQADPNTFARFTHKASGPNQESVGGGVPWGLDVMARTVRRVFESART